MADKSLSHLDKYIYFMLLVRQVYKSSKSLMSCPAVITSPNILKASHHMTSYQAIFVALATDCVVTDHAQRYLLHNAGVVGSDKILSMQSNQNILF